MGEKMNPVKEKTRVQRYTALLQKRRWLTESTMEVEFSRPSKFPFTPGQRICFVYQGKERDYSLISAPDDTKLAICIRLVEGGFFSPILAAAEIGTRLSFTGPHGYFTFHPSERPAIFVATGTGIAPFVSMSRSGTTGFTLLHGVRTPPELYYESLFRTAAKAYVPCLTSAPKDASLPESAFNGRVTDYLEKHLPFGAYDFYLCGRQDMIRDVTFLVDERFPGPFIYTEIFY